MALNNDEMLKLCAAVLSSGTLDSNAQSKWFEKRNANSFVIDPKSVWGELNLLQDLPANNFAQAVAHAVANPNLMKMYGINDDGTYDDTTAIRLTPLAGTNNKTYIAYSEYGNGSSAIYKNWVVPQLIPRASGAPSSAYQAQVWIGKPSAGQPLLSSAGSDGDWTSHVWNAAAGALLISEADAPPSATIPSDDLYLTGFQYVGAGASGGFSGSTILLEDPEGQWRIRNEYPHLLFERKEFDENDQPVWNTYSSMGHSIATDGVKLHRPYDIAVDFSKDINDVTDGTIDPDYKSVFRVAGTNDAFIYGNTEQQTVIETQKGTDIKRAAAIREEQEVENRPLADLEVILDNTDTPEVGSVTELSWVSNINYTPDADFIRFNEIAFDVLESSDDVNGAPLRIAVEFPDGRLIQENLTLTALNAGINGGFNLRTGFDFNTITPRYTDQRLAVTVTRIQIAKGYKVKLSAGTYDFVDPTDNTTKQQVVPRQKSKVEFSNDVTVWDSSNWQGEMYRESNLWMTTGAMGAWFPEETGEEATVFAKVADHTSSDEAVLGNHNGATHIATGDQGLFVLFEDSSARADFFSEGDIVRIGDGLTPTFFIETNTVTLNLDGVFATELTTLGWDIVNTTNFKPLIRYEGDEPNGYRVTINSNIEPDLTLQESQNRFEFLDGQIRDGFEILPTIDANASEYVPLKLPRNKFSVNEETPRTITYTFQNPIKLYGTYVDPVDPADITTGTFVPSIKSDVYRVFHESVVSGSDLEDRLDAVQGEIEWDKATEGLLDTIHIVPSLLVWATEDDEWILWSDNDTLFNDDDIHQWIVTDSGSEAYFELTDRQGSWSNNNSVFTFEPTVVHVPYERTNGFEVSFGWSDTFDNNGSLEYGVFSFYIHSHGRNQDSLVTINIPKNASITWRFRKRRDGSFSYIATPMNDNLASSKLNHDDGLALPEDPEPPIIL